MAKSQKLEALTAALHEIRSDPTSETSLATLGQIIGSQYGVAVAQAAQMVAEHEIYGLMPELVKAFDRFMVKAKDRDPGCRAKDAIANTLYRLEHSDETVFLQGIRHVQREPVWGGQVDTAPKLRGTCALGLVRMHYPRVMVELADLLADPEQEARIGAARAVAYSANDFGVALLRLRIKVGDVPAVVGECLAALLKLAPADSLPLVQSFLLPTPDSPEAGEKAEVAALVLGESRLPEAFPLLRNWWQRSTRPEMRKTGLLAIATLRQDEPLEFLLSLIAEGSRRDATDAYNALGIYQNDDILWPQVAQIAAERGDLG